MRSRDTFTRLTAPATATTSPGEAVELVNAKLTGLGSLRRLAKATNSEREPRSGDLDGAAAREVDIVNGGFIGVPVLQRALLADGRRVDGPAIVEEYDSTTYLPPGWSLAVNGEVLAREPARMSDPITVEIIKSALVYASEEMGIAVRNSAYSPNIKERLDHSCALFDRVGRLIAQAEHIPMHLGSLPWGLRVRAATRRSTGRA